MRDFEYEAPTSVAEAVKILSQYNGKARPLAGGTDLIDQVRVGRLAPDMIVDVATLTGHMVMALGTKVSAVFGSDDVVGPVVEAGRESGEKHWPMPLPPDIVERTTTTAYDVDGDGVPDVIESTTVTGVDVDGDGSFSDDEITIESTVAVREDLVDDEDAEGDDAEGEASPA